MTKNKNNRNDWYLLTAFLQDTIDHVNIPTKDKRKNAKKQSTQPTTDEYDDTIDDENPQEMEQTDTSSTELPNNIVQINQHTHQTTGQQNNINQNINSNNNLKDNITQPQEQEIPKPVYTQPDKQQDRTNQNTPNPQQQFQEQRQNQSLTNPNYETTINYNDSLQKENINNTQPIIPNNNNYYIENALQTTAENDQTASQPPIALQHQQYTKQPTIKTIPEQQPNTENQNEKNLTPTYTEPPNINNQQIQQNNDFTVNTIENQTNYNQNETKPEAPNFNNNRDYQTTQDIRDNRNQDIPQTYLDYTSRLIARATYNPPSDNPTAVFRNLSETETLLPEQNDISTIHTIPNQLQDTQPTPGTQNTRQQQQTNTNYELTTISKNAQFTVQNNIKNTDQSETPTQSTVLEYQEKQIGQTTVRGSTQSFLTESQIATGTHNSTTVTVDSSLAQQLTSFQWSRDNVSYIGNLDHNVSAV